MNTNRHNDPDMLESALAELRRQGETLGPSPQALARVREALATAERKTPGLNLAERIGHMRLWKKSLSIAAVAAVVIIGVAVWMYLPRENTGGVVFADVQRQIEQMQTMSLTMTSQMKGMAKPITMKMFFKYPGLTRMEMTMDPADFMPPGTSRPASMPGVVKSVSIANIAEGRVVSLVPSQKKAVIIDMKNMPPEQIAKEKNQNILDVLKKAVAGEHQELGEKKINDISVKGYRCKYPEAKQITMDIWVDATTAKPVEVEQTFPESFGGLKSTMTDLEANPRLDDSLFDMTMPEGYAVEQQTMDFNVIEEDIIKGLGSLAKMMGGEFPKSLIPTPEIIKQLSKLLDQRAEKLKQTGASKEEIKAQFEAEGKELGIGLQKTMLFQAKTMQGGEFVYVGEGVKLGDKATPILWYKAKDAKVYRVIYGDLHVEDAVSPPARPATQPADNSAPTGTH